MTKLDRRSFVRGSAATALFLNTSLAAARPRRRSPNEEIRVAVVGIRSRGWNHVTGFSELPDVRVVALCDVDEEILGKRAQELGDSVGTYTDLRHVLEREDIDVVSIASPNHWHALQTIWACQAGKDVYVEKPISHNVWEGRKVVEAARKYDRIVQTGTQCRSSDGLQEAIAWVNEGNLGAIELAHGFCYKPRMSIGKVDGPQGIPESVDYDLWTGPAPLKALMRSRLHYDWHWVSETGNGDLGNQGIHQMDICRWVLGESKLAPRVVSAGGRFGYQDDGDTPNSQLVFLDYERAPLLFEVRGLPKNATAREEGWGGADMDDYMGVKIGVVVHCENGTLRIPGYSTAFAVDSNGKEVQRWEGASNHYANFIDAVRNRDSDRLTADIEEGHLSSALCHIGNVSYTCGRSMTQEEAMKLAANKPAFGEGLERLYAHLGANGLDPESEQLSVGPWLEVDPVREVFLDETANRLISREYREPFLVPESV